MTELRGLLYVEFVEEGFDGGRVSGETLRLVGGHGDLVVGN